MAHVFISYSHKDKEYARKLADELKRRGIDAWIDDRIDYRNNLAACYSGKHQCLSRFYCHHVFERIQF